MLGCRLLHDYRASRLHVGLAIWYTAGRIRSQKVSLSNVDACRFGLNRNAKYRALGWLESAELISVERKMGRSPMVTVFENGGSLDRKP